MTLDPEAVAKMAQDYTAARNADVPDPALTAPTTARGRS